MLSPQPVASIACSWLLVLEVSLKGGWQRGGQHRDSHPLPTTISKGNSASDSHKSSQAEATGRGVVGNDLLLTETVNSHSPIPEALKKPKMNQTVI